MNWRARWKSGSGVRAVHKANIHLQIAWVNSTLVVTTLRLPNPYDRPDADVVLPTSGLAVDRENMEPAMKNLTTPRIERCIGCNSCSLRALDWCTSVCPGWPPASASCQPVGCRPVLRPDPAWPAIRHPVPKPVLPAHIPSAKAAASSSKRAGVFTAVTVPMPVRWIWFISITPGTLRLHPLRSLCPLLPPRLPGNDGVFKGNIGRRF